MKRKSLLIMLLVALFVPLAMNAQTQRLRKNVTRAPRPELQFEVAGQLQTIENFQPGKVYHRAAVNNRDDVLYSNGFNSQADLSDISIYDNDGDGYNWGWYNSQGVTGVSGDYALGSQSYDNDAGALTPDNWLIMPAITLPSGNAQYFASIYARSYGGYGETIGIFVAPEDDNYIYQVGSDFNLTQDAFVLCEVDLSAYAGQTIEIYIRHYNCTDGFYLFVDDFSIYSRVAEEEITIGSGTSTNAYVPTRTQRRYSLTQQIYTATEIGHTDGGNITSVSFYGNRAATRTLDIYMVNTTQSTIASNTAFHPTTSDRVYSGSVSFTANAWTKITFDTPFEYTGGNVVLIVDDNTGSAANQATNFRVFTANNQAIYIHGAQTNTNTNYNPTSTNLSYTAQNTKNQVKFTMEAEPTPVESITASDLSLIAGFSAQIDYTVLPADATNPAVTFTSANTAVATVSANGVVTGVAAGTTTITLTSVSNPEVSTTINVEVTPFVGLIFDFETDPNEEGWTFVDSDGDGFNWEWEDCSETPHNTPFEGDGCLFSASYDNDNSVALHPDNWAITPAIHILSSPSVVYLYAQGQDADWAAEHFQVYIGTSPDPSSMTAISSEFVATGSYVQYSANIPDTYAGQIVYLAIRHFNVSDMFVLDVDYIVITNAELAPDQDPVQFTVNAPANAHPGQTITVEGVLTAPTSGTWNGFTALILDITYDNTAFAYVPNSQVYGPVATQAQQNGALMMPGTLANAVQLSMIISDNNNSVSTEGVVFSAQFTVLAETGEYTFTAVPHEGNLSYDVELLPYEATPSTVVVTVEQYTKDIAGWDVGEAEDAFNFYLIASPIGDVDPTAVTITSEDPDKPADVTNMVEGSFDFYYFDHSKDLEWVNYNQGEGAEPGFNLLESGKGYLYANKYDVTLVFTGSAYTTTDGTETVELDYTDGSGVDLPGWNLVGNPFAETAYLAGNCSFYTMSPTGYFEATTNPSIEAMEGIFVEATATGETVTFTTTQPNSKSPVLNLNLSNGRKVVDRAIVRFDGGKQLSKLQFREGSTKVYIPVEGHDYAVVNCEEMGELPVSFKAEENGSYNLNLSSEEVSFAYLHLIDNMTGADVDLLETPSYSFEAKTTDYANRFKLVFATGDNSNDDNFAFFSNGSFVINNDGEATLQVIDVTGRILRSESINGCTNVNVNAASGVYMLRLINGDNVKVQKVVVK